MSTPLHFPLSGPHYANPRVRRRMPVNDRTGTEERDERLDRREARIEEREQAIAKREKDIRRRELAIEAIEDDDTGASAVEDVGVVDEVDQPSRPGTTAPGRMTEAARLIIQADAMRRGELATPTPKTTLDPAAKLIIKAVEQMQSPQAKQQPGDPNMDATVRFIINADRVRRGDDRRGRIDGVIDGREPPGRK
jgi:hypothetical protein